MKIEAVSTPKAPQALGPYSQAIRLGEFLFLSGQIALDPETGKIIGENVEAQTTQVLKNISAVLSSQGLTLKNVVKSTVFLKDLNDFGAFNDIYGRLFTPPYPARSTVEVARLPKDVLIEIEVLAHW